MARGAPLAIVALAAVAGAAGLWLGARSSAPPPPPTTSAISLAPGARIPDLVLPQHGGGTRALSTLRGRPLLVNVWASWCAPCIEEMPLLDAFARAQRADGVQVVGIALDDADAVARFLATTPVSYPILLDRVGPDDAAARLGNRIGALPYTVLIDADGVLRAQKFGPFRGDELEEWARAGIRD